MNVRSVGWEDRRYTLFPLQALAVGLMCSQRQCSSAPISRSSSMELRLMRSYLSLDSKKLLERKNQITPRCHQSRLSLLK